MKHFILTRFNDIFPNSAKPRLTADQPELGIVEEWLRKRIKIFYEITVPSIEQQTDKDFIWILKCHPRTPHWAKSKLKKDFIVSFDEFDGAQNKQLYYDFVFSNIIKKHTKDKEIITTRLDSDDAISNFHISMVKDFAKPKMFFDFRRGLVKSQGSLYYHIKSGVSQFCSYFSYKKNETVFKNYHPCIKNEQCIIINTELGWFQNNMSNNITVEIKKNRKYYEENKINECDLFSILNKFLFLKQKKIFL
jgi:hypothetical protein